MIVYIISCTCGYSNSHRWSGRIHDMAITHAELHLKDDRTSLPLITIVKEEQYR